jgi:hypothetical protein
MEIHSQEIAEIGRSTFSFFLEAFLKFQEAFTMTVKKAEGLVYAATLEEIRKAAERIEPYARKTPVCRWIYL